MPVTIGIQNLTGAELLISDLGLFIPTSSTLDLSGSYTPEQIRFSFDLQTAIQNNQAVIVENGVSMSKIQSLDFSIGRPLAVENPIALGAGSNVVTSGTGIITVSGSTLGENLLINSSFRINQRNTGFVYTDSSFWSRADGAYTIDRWIIVSPSAIDGAVNVHSGLFTSDVALYGTCVLTVVVNNTQFGICQPIEHRYFEAAIGKKVSLQFKARQGVGTSINKVRASVLSWGGTLDNVDTSIVTDFGSAGTTPFLTGLWSHLQVVPVGAFTDLTSSYQLYKLEGVSVPSTCNNLAVLIWADDTVTTVSDTLEITEVKLEIGERCTEYREREFLEDMRLCQRYFCKTMSVGLAALTNMGTAGCLSVHSNNTAAGEVTTVWRFPVEMLTSPTITTFNPSAGNFSWDRAGTSIGASVEYISQHGVIISNSVSTTNDARHNIHACAQAEL